MACLNVRINNYNWIFYLPVKWHEHFCSSLVNIGCCFHFRTAVELWKLKKIKSYTSIWSVEKSFMQSTRFSTPVPAHIQSDGLVRVSLVVILFGELPPFNMIDGAFLKYFGIPVAFTWFVSQKTFWRKAFWIPKNSCVSFFSRPKVTYAEKLSNWKIRNSIQAWPQLGGCMFRLNISKTISV